MRARLAIPTSLLAFTLAAALGAAPALASSPAAHTTAEPAKVIPYPASVPPSRARPHANVAESGPQPCTGTGTISASQTYDGFGYLANQIAQAYQLTPFYQEGDEGQGQTIALLELEPNSATDIDAYQGCYQTHATVNYIPVDGGVGGTGTDTTDPGSGEAALDIEQIIGLAPQATIDVYQAPNTTTGILDAYQAMVNNPAVTIISTSWGACETGDPLPTVEAPIFATAAHDGISTFAAAGDSGSTDCGTSALAVDDPASQPDVTGVGGTTLPNLSAGQQFAWNGTSMSAGVTGGGFSALWSEPSWQQAAAAPAQTGAAAAGELSCPAAASGGYCRGVPDVSADADPYTGYIIYLTQNVTNPQTGTTSPQLTAAPWGGTSAAAPLWAAMTALINASPACNGHNLGPLNPLLYQVSVKGMPGLTNITAGNNDDTADNPTAYFTADRGFSPVTGLGTPLAAPLARSLCAQADTLTLNAPTVESSSYGQPVDVSAISASDAQGHALSYSATGLPAGLAIDPATGAITGAPTANATASVRVTATAADNGATQTRVISWTVTGAPATTTTPTTTTTGGTPSSGGGTPRPTPVRVIHITRRFRGHTISITLTITTRHLRRRLLLRYTARSGRAKGRLETVELVLRPRSADHRARPHRPTVLRRAHGAHGQLAVALTPMRVTRRLALVLQYSSGPRHLVALPHL
ncbi:MAG: putative Ig domain-containing protein [Pseudonocardiaceae bacterium]